MNAFSKCDKYLLVRAHDCHQGVFFVQLEFAVLYLRHNTLDFVLHDPLVLLKNSLFVDLAIALDIWLITLRRS